MDIRLREPDDFHLHLRQDQMLTSVAPISAESFRRGLIMPNTLPPVIHAAGVDAYRKQIHKAAPGFEPLMTFKLVPGLEPEEVSRLAQGRSTRG